MAGRNELTVDLERLQITHPDGLRLEFAFDAHSQETLVLGLDDIARTLKREAAIDAFEATYRRALRSRRYLVADGVGKSARARAHAAAASGRHPTCRPSASPSRPERAKSVAVSSRQPPRRPTSGRIAAMSWLPQPLCTKRHTLTTGAWHRCLALAGIS